MFPLGSFMVPIKKKGSFMVKFWMSCVFHCPSSTKSPVLVVWSYFFRLMVPRDSWFWPNVSQNVLCIFKSKLLYDAVLSFESMLITNKSRVVSMPFGNSAIHFVKTSTSVLLPTRWSLGFQVKWLGFDQKKFLSFLGVKYICY